MGFAPIKLPATFPAAFSPCLLNLEAGLLLLEHCSPRCRVFLFILLAWDGLVELTLPWTEPQKLNVASERVKNQD